MKKTYPQGFEILFVIINLTQSLNQFLRMQEQEFEQNNQSRNNKKQSKINDIIKTSKGRQSSQNILIFKEQQFQCRICLQEMQQNQTGGLCACKGSTSYSHKACMIEWMKKAPKYRKFPLQYYYLCDVCKATIYLETQFQIKCAETQNIQLFEQCEGWTFPMIVVLLIGMVILGVTIYVSSLKSNSTGVIIFISIGYTISLLTIISDILVFIFSVFLQIQVQVKGIINKDSKIKNSHKIKNNKVAPQLDLDNSNSNLGLRAISNQAFS